MGNQRRINGCTPSPDPWGIFLQGRMISPRTPQGDWEFSVVHLGLPHCPDVSQSPKGVPNSEGTCQSSRCISTSWELQVGQVAEWSLAQFPHSLKRRSVVTTVVERNELFGYKHSSGDLSLKSGVGLAPLPTGYSQLPLDSLSDPTVHFLIIS